MWPGATLRGELIESGWTECLDFYSCFSRKEFVAPSRSRGIYREMYAVARAFIPAVGTNEYPNRGMGAKAVRE
jgi:hypothetical protein